MRLIVAGSRKGIPKEMVFQYLNEEVDITEDLEIVSGGAQGVDKFGEEWAFNNNIDVKLFPADWDTYGKSAGYRRNVDMSRYADVLFAFWDGKSKGTEHMIKIMSDLKKPAAIFHYNPDNQNFESEEPDE